MRGTAPLDSVCQVSVAGFQSSAGSTAVECRRRSSCVNLPSRAPCHRGALSADAVYAGRPSTQLVASSGSPGSCRSRRPSRPRSPPDSRGCGRFPISGSCRAILDRATAVDDRSDCCPVLVARLRTWLWIGSSAESSPRRSVRPAARTCAGRAGASGWVPATSTRCRWTG